MDGWVDRSLVPSPDPVDLWRYVAWAWFFFSDLFAGQVTSRGSYLVSVTRPDP